MKSVGFLLIGAAFLMWAGPRALSAEGPQRHGRGVILVVCPPAGACHDKGKPRHSHTACMLDLAGESIVAPRGTRLSCIKVSR